MVEGAWTEFADVLLSQEALLARLRFDTSDPMAGMHVSADEVERIVDELDSGDLADAVRRQWRPRLELARAALEEELEERDSPFAALVRHAALDPHDAEVLALLCAVEVDSRRQRLLVFIQDDITRTWPTNETIARAFGPEHSGVHALAPSGSLANAALLRPADPEPWAKQMARLEPAVAWWLLGDDRLDPTLGAGTRIIERQDHEPRPDEDDDEDDEPQLVLVTGADRVRRRELAIAELRADQFLVVASPADDAWPVIVRQATLGGYGVIVESDGSITAEGRSWIERAAHLSWAVSCAKEIPVHLVPDRPWVERRTGSADVDDDEWLRVLGTSDRHGHRLSAEHVEDLRVVSAALDGDIDAAVRRLASGLLDGLATRLRPRRTWDDLVLPPAQLRDLHDLCERYRQRHRVYDEWGFQAIPSAGLVALFAGPSGTGKTMTAEVVAGDLGLDLYRIDLSSITSKWVGETEKNLERIFSAAAAGNLVLFFDEADAVFGRRSEVKEANDRYANMEVSYLLQRLETYDGLVILATNLQQNIDRAFMRRVHVSVEFGIPEVHERQKIWERCLPPSAPRDEIDFALLAEKFDLAGGNIRSAALTAGFLAATAGAPISMRHVMLGLHRELRKVGRLATEAMFGSFLAELQDEFSDQRTR